LLALSSGTDVDFLKNLLKGFIAPSRAAIALAMTLILYLRPAAALDPDLPINQLRHTGW
jgi:hypothetical protein